MTVSLRALEDTLESRLLRWDTREPDPDTWRVLNALLWETHTALRQSPAEERAQRLGAWRARFHPYFLQAPCIRHAWRKPLGYAGDYQLMDTGYANMPEGETALGRMLHQWFSLTLGGTAVRSRRRWILLEMQRHGRAHSEDWRVMSVASGSAWEFRDLLAESFLVDRAQIRCVDQDPRALAAARAGYDAAAQTFGRRAPITFVHQDIRALIRGQGEHPPQDFVYSLGLYDYLDERAARRLTASLFGLLRPGGRLIVGNYNPSNDAQPLLELIMDWPLIHRSAAEVAALADGLDGEAAVVPDSTGTMNFLRIDRP